LRRRTKAAFIVMLAFLLSSIALPYLSSASTQSYSGQVASAELWIGNDTPSGSVFISVNEPAFGTVNATYPGHTVIFDPAATGGPLIAGFQASQKGAQYLIITSTIPDLFNEYTTSSLSGAPMVYSTSDVHIFKVVY
jgi:hypothetical protein